MTPPPPISALVPQQGRMMLLDRILGWDAATIRCAARSHRDPANPLRRDGRLGVAAGIEYGAQAIAAHGALCAGGQAQPGLLAGLRDVRWSVGRLDDLPAEIEVAATLARAERTGLIYGFALRSGERVLVEGQATIRLG